VNADPGEPTLESGELLGFEGPVPSRGKRAFRALRHREYRLVWGTFMVGQLGFWISFISLQALMARLTHSSGSWLGLLFFVNFSPMLVFTPVAGVVADRIERKQILQTTFSLLAILMSGLAFMTLSGRATPLLLLPFAFGVGSLFSFNAPASQSIVANSVPRFDLPSAISLQSAGQNLARVVGPTVAAPILGLWNEGAAFAVYAAACTTVVLLLRPLHLSTYTPEVDDGRFLRRVHRGFEHARERPPALAVLSVLAMSSLFAAAYLSLLPVLAAEVYDRGPAGFTTLAAVTGIGSMIGALTTAFRDSVPTLRYSALLVAGFGASVAAFGSMRTWPMALALSVVVGIFYFSGMTTLNTLLQYLADEKMRGRISSLFVICWAGLVPLGGLWQGLSAARNGVRVTMILAGCITAAYALGVALIRGRRAEPRVHWIAHAESDTQLVAEPGS
jgi:MFS family permease